MAKVGIGFSLLAALALLVPACGRSASDDGPCTSPELEPETGLTLCEEGQSYRAKAVACAFRGSDLAEAAGSESGGVPAHVGMLCATHADCAGLDRGYCDVDRAMYDLDVCRQGCLDDDECLAGELCHCTELGGVCVSASCRDDGDCAEGSHCLAYWAVCAEMPAFACQTPRDECASYRDCPGDYGSCQFDGERFYCEGGVC